MEVIVDVLEEQAAAEPVGAEAQPQQAVHEVEIARDAVVDGGDEVSTIAGDDDDRGARPGLAGAHHPLLTDRRS